MRPLGFALLLVAPALAGCLGPPPDSDPALGTAPRPLGATHLGSRRLPLASVAAVHATGDATSDLIVAGTFVGSIDLGTGPLVSEGYNDVVLARVADDGTTNWARRFGGAGGDWVVDAAPRADGSTVLLAQFQGAADFGTGVLTASGLFDMVLAIYDADGEAVLVRQLGDDGDQFARALALAPDGGFIVAGRFRFDLDLGLGTLTATDGLADVFVAAYDPSLALRWSRRLGGARVDDVFDAAVHPSGAISLVGVSETSFEGRTSRGAADAFLVRLDAAGTVLWARGFGGEHVDVLGAVAADGEDAVAAGFFSGDADLGTGPLTAEDVGEAVVARWRADGTTAWVRRLAGYDVPALFGLAVAADGTAWTVGRYREWAAWNGERTVAIERGDVVVVGVGRDGTPRTMITAGSRDEEYAVTILPRGDELVVTGGLEHTLDLGGGELPGSAADGATFLARWRP